MMLAGLISQELSAWPAISSDVRFARGTQLCQMLGWSRELGAGEKGDCEMRDVLLTAWGLLPIGLPKLFPKSHLKSGLVKYRRKDCRPQKASSLCL